MMRVGHIHNQIHSQLSNIKILPVSIISISITLSISVLAQVLSNESCIGSEDTDETACWNITPECWVDGGIHSSGPDLLMGSRLT